ncbi:unnamed protein product [Prunus brigantina]
MCRPKNYTWSYEVSLSDSKLKWSASQGSFYCCLCVPPACSLLIFAMVCLVVCVGVKGL